MTPDHSTRHRSVAPVTNPTARAVLASFALVVLGPLVAMVAYTHPMFGVGGLLGFLARPALRLSRRVARSGSQLLERSAGEPTVAATGASLDTSAE